MFCTKRISLHPSEWFCWSMAHWGPFLCSFSTSCSLFPREPLLQKQQLKHNSRVVAEANEGHRMRGLMKR